jgi:hypothetical protein
MAADLQRHFGIELRFLDQDAFVATFGDSIDAVVGFNEENEFPSNSSSLLICLRGVSIRGSSTACAVPSLGSGVASWIHLPEVRTVSSRTS